MTVGQLVQDSIEEAWVQRSDAVAVQLSGVGLVVSDLGLSRVSPVSLLCTSFGSGPGCGGVSGAGPGEGIVIFGSLFNDGVVDVIVSALVEGV